MSFRFAVHVMSHKINHEFHSILFECKFWRKHLFVSRLLLLCTQLIVIFLYTWDTQLQVFWGVGFLIFKNCQFILVFLVFFGYLGFLVFLSFFFFAIFILALFARAMQVVYLAWAIIWIYLPLKETQCL